MHNPIRMLLEVLSVVSKGPQTPHVKDSIVQTHLFHDFREIALRSSAGSGVDSQSSESLMCHGVSTQSWPAGLAVSLEHYRKATVTRALGTI